MSWKLSVKSTNLEEINFLSKRKAHEGIIHTSEKSLKLQVAGFDFNVLIYVSVIVLLG